MSRKRCMATYIQRSAAPLCFADYFFDNLFTDWLVRTRINESRNKAEQTSGQIQKVLQNLHQIKEQNICIQRQLEKGAGRDSGSVRSSLIQLSL